MPSNQREPRWHGDHASNGNPREFVIDNLEYERVLFGEGPDDPDTPACPECGVAQGALHKLGCTLEPCPRCGAPAVSCDCAYEDD